MTLKNTKTELIDNNQDIIKNNLFLINKNINNSLERELIKLDSWLGEEVIKFAVDFQVKLQDFINSFNFESKELLNKSIDFNTYKNIIRLKNRLKINLESCGLSFQDIKNLNQDLINLKEKTALILTIIENSQEL